MRLLLEASALDRGVSHAKLESCRVTQEDDMKGRNPKTQRMLSHIAFTVMLVDAAKWGQHFRRSFLFKPTVMYERVIKIHGGVSDPSSVDIPPTIVAYELYRFSGG